jgi:hypothetical protein
MSEAGAAGEYDPGWSPVLRGALLMSVPGIGLQLARRRRAGQPPNGLTVLRYLYVAFVNAMVLIGVVVIVLATVAEIGVDGISAGVAAAAVTLVGAISFLVAPAVERPLDCSDDKALAASYQTRFFVRIAFAEAGVLAGFAGFIVSDRWWIYLIRGGLRGGGLHPARAHRSPPRTRPGGARTRRLQPFPGRGAGRIPAGAGLGVAPAPPGGAGDADVEHR